jgi:hypothetical protein
MTTITLKDAAAADVVFTLQSVQGRVHHFVHAGESLLDSERLHLSIVDQGKVARIKGALFIPTVGTNPSTGLPSVLWQEAGSFDLTSVKAASSVSAEDFVARFASLASSEYVASMYTTGVQG